MGFGTFVPSTLHRFLLGLGCCLALPILPLLIGAIPRTLLFKAGAFCCFLFLGFPQSGGSCRSTLAFFFLGPCLCCRLFFLVLLPKGFGVAQCYFSVDAVPAGVTRQHGVVGPSPPLACGVVLVEVSARCVALWAWDYHRYVTSFRSVSHDAKLILVGD